MKKLVCCFAGWLLLATISTAQVHSQIDSNIKRNLLQCDKVNSGFCTEVSHRDQSEKHYSGHDEPALIFYSDRPGSGNNTVYRVTIPSDPAVAPQQDGSGGTFSFQLHAAFWFGMALCDSQSSPNFTSICQPRTDANIFDNPDPNARDFIGHHPGTAFLELQFYPAGGANLCSDPARWCAAIAIFSMGTRDLASQLNNADCINSVGTESVNFAFVTNDGVSQTAADPLNPDTASKFNEIPGRTFNMNPGDRLLVSIRDTPEGVRVDIRDLTTGTHGSMTASIANGFAQVNFVPDPDPSHPSVACSSTPYAFHPMYATASEHTRVPWSAHSYNIAFADELGHFELCNAVDFEGGNCIQASANDPGGLDADDTTGSPQCFSGDFLASLGFQPVGNCVGGDGDFDGTPYRNNKWPGTGNPLTDRRLHSTPIRFSSPRFRASGDEDDRWHDFSRVAFEADLPGIEQQTNHCNLLTGQGCTNPPTGTEFYPIFSTFRHGDECLWQIGGAHIAGTEENFGGNSTAEFGDLLSLFVITPIDAAHPKGGSLAVVSDYRRILNRNPCRREEED